MEDDNCIRFTVSDTIEPFTFGMEFAELTDTIDINEDKKVYALIQNNERLLVEYIDENCVLPGGIITAGETAKDALYRVLRTDYCLDCSITEKVTGEEAILQKYARDGECYFVILKGEVDNKRLKWIPKPLKIC